MPTLAHRLAMHELRHHLAMKSLGLTIKAVAALVVGGFWTSLSVIWAWMWSYRIWPAGGESACPSPDGAYFDLAPDWVCEVLSPGTARLDRVEKMPLYARHGVSHIWLVEPVLRTLEVFENTPNGWLLLGAFENDDAISIAPFAATNFNLGVLWAD
jgi:hypothetical protein